jgi:membrane-associated phospholipid phosphatase
LGLKSACRQVGRRGAGCVMAVLLGGGMPAQAATNVATVADTPAPVESTPVWGTVALPDSAPVPVEGDGRRTLGRLPVNLGRGIIGVFHGDNLAPALVGGVTTGGVAFFDARLKDSVSNPDSGFGKSLETAGGWPSTALVVGLFAAGRFTHGSRFRAMSYDLVDVTIVNFGYTELLKLAVRRERPDGSNKLSFPSGHSSNAFALATVAELHYGWKVGLPAYALAAAIGYSRIVRDKHYASDVVAGAAVGYIVGRTVVRVNGRPLADASHRQVSVNLAPILARHAQGLQLTLLF